jgi:Peptidase S46
MNKKILLVFLVSSLFLSLKVKADEGMWLPLLINRLNYVDMQKMGCHLTAEEIYSANNSSLKDAIVSFNNGGCSGVMVSAEGLFFTAHHCGEGYIQSHSSVDKDYLANGFWAMEKAEELRNDKISATFLIRIEDVTGKILPYVNDKMPETQRQAIIDSISTALEKTAIKGTTYNGKVLSFFEGNEYYLFVTETYKDVRLVGAPPITIGQFGGDTDNWMWPNEGGDFSLFRVYMSPDGGPADYSKKNIPYKPKHFLPVSIKGIKKDEFAMAMGYPGTTDRFMASYGVKVATDKYNPSIVKIRDKKLSIMTEDMKASPEVNIQYAEKYLNCSNYYKYFIGQTEQLKKLNVYEKKLEIEKAFTTWYNSNPKSKEKYGKALGDLEKAWDNVGKYTIPYMYYREAIIRGIEIIKYANTYEELYKQSKLNVDEEAMTRLSQSLTYNAKIFFKSYNMPTDKKICLAMLNMFYADVPKEFHPDIYATIQRKYKNDVGAFVNELYDQSIFASKDKILDFLITPDYKKLDKDPGWIAMESFYNKYEEISVAYNNARLELIKGNRLFVEGIMEMNKDKKYYPNANNTMRLTYGKVTDYNPNSTTNLNYFTTLDELIAKEDPKNPDFIVPSKLKLLYQNKDYGKYATDGKIHTCFITNDDITGGVSGGAVIDGDGNLIGIVFDLNMESTGATISFDANYQRTICLDIKYALFLIDKYGGATNIIKELTLKE